MTCVHLWKWQWYPIKKQWRSVWGYDWLSQEWAGADEVYWYRWSVAWLKRKLIGSGELLGHSLDWCDVGTMRASVPASKPTKEKQASRKPEKEKYRGRKWKISSLQLHNTDKMRRLLNAEVCWSESFSLLSTSDWCGDQRAQRGHKVTRRSFKSSWRNRGMVW